MNFLSKREMGMEKQKEKKRIIIMERESGCFTV